MWNNYCKIILRNLIRYKGYTFINIADLTIGITCCFLIILFVMDEMSYDKHFEKADQIYRVGVRGVVGEQEMNSARTSSMMSETLLEEYPEVIHATRMSHTPNMLVRYEEKVFNEKGFFWVDSNFFDVFSIPMIHGNPNTALEDDHTLVITEDVALKYFATTADAINKVVTFEDETPYKITGVIENPKPNSHFHCGMISPLSSWDWDFEQFWLNNYMHTYIVLHKNVPPEQLEAKFPALVNKYVAPDIQRGLGISLEEYEASGDKIGFFLQPILDIHLFSQLEGEIEPNSDIKYVYIFSILALFIIIIASINYMNLSTARAAERSLEVGIRKVVGSNRIQLVNQFLFESIILTLIAMLLSLVLVAILLPYFNNIAGKQLEAGYFENWFVLPGILLISLLTGLLAGSYPAFFLASFQPVRVLKGFYKVSNSSTLPSVRNVLVVFQFVISIFLFVTTFIMFNQMQYIQNKRLGFQKDNILVIKRGWAVGQNSDGTEKDSVGNSSVLDLFKNELKQNPNVVSAGGTSHLPGSTNYYHWYVVPENASIEERHPINYFFADYDFAETLNLKFTEGNYFIRGKTNIYHSVIINEATAQALGYKKPYVGKQIGFPGEEIHYSNIIGVIKDYHYQSLHQKIEPFVMGMRDRQRTYIAVRISSHNIAETIKYIGDTWNKYIPYKPFEYSFLDEDYDALYNAETVTLNLFAIFSSLAIFIACLGLFGLSSFTVHQKGKEIAIRKVLGDSVPNIVFRLSKEFARWIILANIIAWPLAWLAMSNWLEDFAYRIDLTVFPFLTAGIFALIIAWLTISYQSIKAALANPIEAIRYE
jgi:putative ABC transport system permease protein